MINKIKELVNVKDGITEISSEMDSLKKEMSSFKDELGALKNLIEGSSARQEEFLKSFQKDMEIIKESKESFQKEVYDFKLLKSQLQHKLIEKFQEELGKELKVNIDKLKQDYEGYAGLRTKVDEVKPKIDELNQAISKLSAVAKGIKQEDFELTKFASKLFAADREKLELMKRIDTLERLISKMRRTSR